MACREGGSRPRSGSRGEGQRGSRWLPRHLSVVPCFLEEKPRQDHTLGLPLFRGVWEGAQGRSASAAEQLGLHVFPGYQPAAGTAGAVFLVSGGTGSGTFRKWSPGWGTVPGNMTSSHPRSLGTRTPPQFPLSVDNLIPQALQSGVPSSASLQRGVCWVRQDAQRRGSGESKGQRAGVRDTGLSSGSWYG